MNNYMILWKAQFAAPVRRKHREDPFQRSGFIWRDLFRWSK